MHTVRNRLDGEFRSSDKGSVGESIDPKEREKDIAPE
jgi:predicted acetyltransferase